jgi:hypothetical protein
MFNYQVSQQIYKEIGSCIIICFLFVYDIAYITKNVRTEKGDFLYYLKRKIPELRGNSGIQMIFLQVVPPGVEPGTQGFSVLCSTS